MLIAVNHSQIVTAKPQGLSTRNEKDKERAREGGGGRNRGEREGERETEVGERVSK